MIKRILVENFMAHKVTALELASGVTVVTGPNNTGKSALVEALRSIAQNPPNKSSIRHGEKKALVRVELDSGEIVEWERSDKTALYKILKPRPEKGHSEDTYAKFGRTPPDDVRSVLRLDPVDTETGLVDIHIGNQRYPIFLLDQSGSQAASFFAASTEAEYLLRMQQTLKSRTDQKKAKRKEFERESSDIEKKLGILSPLNSIAPVLARTELLYKLILAEEKALPLLEGFIQDLADVVASHSKTLRAGSSLELLSYPPMPLETAPIETLAHELESKRRLWGQLHRKQECLVSVRDIPVIEDTQGLGEIVRSIEKANEDHCKALDRLKTIGESHSPPLISDVTELSSLLEGIQQKEKSLARLLTERDVLNRLVESPSLHEAKELAEILKSLRKLSRDLSRSAMQHDALRSVLSPPEMEDLELLRGLIQRVEEVKGKVAGSVQKHEILKGLKALPEAYDSSSLEFLVCSISEFSARMDCLTRAREIMTTLEVVPELAATREMEETLGGISALEERILGLAETQRRQHAEIQEKRDEIEKVLSEAGSCPLCGHIMDLTHFLEEHHG